MKENEWKRMKTIKNEENERTGWKGRKSMQNLLRSRKIERKGWKKKKIQGKRGRKEQIRRKLEMQIKKMK